MHVFKKKKQQQKQQLKHQNNLTINWDKSLKCTFELCV